jgi:hypothetical protein
MLCARRALLRRVARRARHVALRSRLRQDRIDHQLDALLNPRVHRVRASSRSRSAPFIFSRFLRERSLRRASSSSSCSDEGW